LYTELY